MWGPTGAPGRTTVALNLAAELTDLLRPAGERVLLVDANRLASAVGLRLGLSSKALSSAWLPQFWLEPGSVAELAVESVESVQLDQSVWGRLFGYGRLLVTGTGDARILFPPMAEPVKFRRAIESGRRKNDAPKPAEPAPAQ